LRRNVAAAAEGDVRMKRAQVGFEADGEKSFLDAFVELEQMRMAAAHTDPDYFRPAFGWKSSEADEREKERFPRNGSESFRKCFLSFSRDVSKEREGEMHLARFQPANAAQMRVEFRETFCYRFGKFDADKKPFRAHAFMVGRDSVELQRLDDVPRRLD